MSTGKQKEYWNVSRQDPLVEEVVKYKSSGTALDLGAGSGRDALFLAQRGFAVTAVDNDKIHQENLKQEATAQSLNLNLTLFDVNAYQPNATFDVVVCDMVLHFFTPDQIQSLITKMQSWTNPHGINVVIGYSDKNPIGKRPYLFKHNELKDYYEKWNVLSYEEKPTPWFQLPNESAPRRNHAVYMIAQKA